MRLAYFDFRFKPLDAARFFPASVRGPVLAPPCMRQRPLIHKSRRRQGVPARVFAPQMSP